VVACIGRGMFSSSLRTTASIRQPAGSGMSLIVPRRRIDCSVASSRSRNPTESPRHGSRSVEPVCGKVSIRPSVGTPLANTTRCSAATLK
jgi:hypothetical protein